MNLNQYSVSAAQPGLSVDAVGKLIVPVPPLSEQASIAKLLEREARQAKELIEETDTAITLLQERRSALISAAVTGKIDVRASAPVSAEAADPAEAA
jgi:type I restriction enzyme S subunit